MNSNITISFLVPTLGQRPRELKRLFDSLYNQTVKNFEVVVVSQDNHEQVADLCEQYRQYFIIKNESTEIKGLARSRNIGLAKCDGDIIVLSDDDCWYPNNTVQVIRNEFKKERIDILLTQIYDYVGNSYYKVYQKMESKIISKFKLLSKSSIEVAFLNKWKRLRFDENFGLGAKFCCGEEVDFLIRAFGDGAYIRYCPEITVYHDKKNDRVNEKRVIAKGALYAKNFGLLTALIVCFRDLIIKKQNNIKNFFKGYYEYNKRIR